MKCVLLVGTGAHLHCAHSVVVPRVKRLRYLLQPVLHSLAQLACRSMAYCVSWLCTVPCSKLTGHAAGQAGAWAVQLPSKQSCTDKLFVRVYSSSQYWTVNEHRSVTRHSNAQLNVLQKAPVLSCQKRKPRREAFCSMARFSRTLFCAAVAALHASYSALIALITGRRLGATCIT